MPLPAGYSAFMSGFPTGIVVLTCIDGYGKPCGLTCSSLISVTLSPPTLLLSVHVRSPTLRAIHELGALAVNLLHARAREAAEVFSTPQADRFAMVSWLPRGRRGLPWLSDDACGWAECTVADVRTVSDHALVMGEVVDVHYTADLPLLYGMRRYSAWQAMPPSE